MWRANDDLLNTHCVVVTDTKNNILAYMFQKYVRCRGQQGQFSLNADTTLESIQRRVWFCWWPWCTLCYMRSQKWMRVAHSGTHSPHDWCRQSSWPPTILDAKTTTISASTVDDHDDSEHQQQQHQSKVAATSSAAQQSTHLFDGGTAVIIDGRQWNVPVHHLQSGMHNYAKGNFICNARYF